MSDFYNSPLRFMGLTKKLSEICEECVPAELFVAGKSTLGRELWGISFGERRGCALYAGAFHAQEWITTLLLVRFIEEIAAALKDRRSEVGVAMHNMLRASGVVIIPCVNPDGCELVNGGLVTAGMYKNLVYDIAGSNFSGWNANICGVDINHNFDAGFDILKKLERAHNIFAPSKRQYGGEKPESEAETKALTTLCRMLKPRHVVAFHSQGEEIYYEYGEHTPINAQGLAERLSSLSGYTLPKTEGMASYGGFKDWFIDEFGKPGFTVEVGRGENPLPLEDFMPIYKKLLPMLIEGIRMNAGSP